MSRTAPECIPQRRPMVFVDEILGPAEDLRTRFTVPAASPYVIGGRLVPEALLEIMAQCFAACTGFLELEAGGSISEGYLASAGKFRVLGPAFSGDVLEASCTLTASIGPIHVIEGGVSRGGVPLASARLKIFIPERDAGGSES